MKLTREERQKAMNLCITMASWSLDVFVKLRDGYEADETTGEEHDVSAKGTTESLNDAASELRKLLAKDS